jgi:Protein of unknown function (DUF1549)/Protein of unknown function (DUF1553)
MKFPVRDIAFIIVVLGGAGSLVGGLLRPSARFAASSSRSNPAAAVPDLKPIAARVDDVFRRRWAEQKLTAATAAPELAVMRRLSLSLCGTIPSLEEVRRFESRPADRRLDAWLDDLLHDRRCADYLAERFARAFVGTEEGPFLRFRRRRFVSWLSDAILENRPYDAIVRNLIADDGLWTDHPATNFLTVTIDEKTERPTPDRLSARVSRAFLGVRLDCAQCHDHPFQPWKQAQFRGLAAFFGAVHSDLRGIRDTENDYQPIDRKGKEVPVVDPCVPFLPDLLPGTGAGGPRDRLAAWVTDARNPNLARITANRVWALLFGRSLAEPVDDLPAAGELHPALLLLAEDFSAHGYDLHRMIRIIADTEAFRLDSASDDASEEHEAAWAVFPLTRLRPEQVAGALFQSASLTTIGPQSHWFARLIAYTGRNDFVSRYGDTGEDEFDARAGTIPQRLLLMNGEIVREQLKDGLLSASSSIAGMAPDDRKAVEVAYLTVLTRPPTPEESAHFAARLAGTAGDERKHRLSDLCWTLINTTEFSWNH